VFLSVLVSLLQSKEDQGAEVNRIATAWSAVSHVFWMVAAAVAYYVLFGAILPFNR